MANGLTQATIDIRANTRGMERDIEKSLRTIELSQINTKKSSQALGRITGQVSEFNKSLEASNARVIAFGASAGAIFAVERAITSLISTTIEVEKKLQDVNVLLNLSSSNLEKFGSSLFSIARNTAQSFSSVADAATELARQGLGVEETLKRTNAALILTRLSGLDATKSVETLTATLNSFSGSALDAVEVVNKLANVDAAFAVSSADLANAISRVGSTAQDAGVSLDELISIVTTAQQTTARGGAVIGNSLKTIFTRLQRGRVQSLLESLGVDTGEGQSAVSLLQQLASTYDTLSASQKSYVAEQVGGVFQINILKAALGDLGKEYSIYDRALQTSLSSTDQAIRRNELLNQTVAALSSQAVANLQQAADKIGSIVFEPNAKNFLSSFNNVLEAFNNIDTESQGGKFIEGFFKGISNFIGGPGTVLAVAVLTKLFVKLTQFAAGSARELLGRNEATKQQAALEQSVLSILQKNTQFTNQILSGKLSTVQAEKQLLNYLTAQSNVMKEQERLSKVIAGNLGRSGVSVGKTGVPTVKSAGFIPNFASEQAIGQAMENAGARQHGYKAGKAKKTRIHDGAGKSFQSWVNNKEDIVNFRNADGKKATIVRPPNGFGENTEIAASGFIPNFALIKGLAAKEQKYNSSSQVKKSYQKSLISSSTQPSFLAGRVFEAVSQGEKNLSLVESKVGPDIKKGKYAVAEAKLSGAAAYKDSNFGLGNPKGNRLLLPSSAVEAYDKKLIEKRGAEIIRSREYSHPKLFAIARKMIEMDNAGKYEKYSANSIPIPLYSGFIPNFAGSKMQAGFKNLMAQQGAQSTFVSRSSKEATLKSGRVAVKDLGSLAYTMIHPENIGIQDTGEVDFLKKDKKTGQPTRYFGKFKTSGLSSSDVAKQANAGSLQKKISNFLLGEANRFAGIFNPGASFSDIGQFSDKSTVMAAVGTVFESAIRKAFNQEAQSKNQAFDFPAPNAQLRDFFGNAPGPYEAKGSNSLPNKQSSLEKWVRNNNLFGGFIPNFASGIVTGDVIRGNEYKAVLDFLAKTPKPVRTILGPSGSGKTTMASKAGGKIVKSFQDLAAFDSYILDRAVLSMPKDQIVADNLKKIFSKSGDRGALDILVGSRNTIKSLREKRAATGDLLTPGRAQLTSGTGGISSFTKGVRGFSSEYPGASVSRIFKKAGEYQTRKILSGGFLPNFATKGLTFSQGKKDEFGFSTLVAKMDGKKVGSFEYSEDKPGKVSVDDISVAREYRGQGIAGELYRKAMEINRGKMMSGQILPQTSRFLEKLKAGQPVSAETLYPQMRRAQMAKKAIFEVWGHKGMDEEQMTTAQFKSFIDAQIKILKNDPDKFTDYFGDVQAGVYRGLGVQLKTQSSAGFIPNFLDIKKSNLPIGVRGRTNYGNGSKSNIELGTGATENTLAHELFHNVYSRSTFRKSVSNPSIGKFISDPKKYAGVKSIISSFLFKGVNEKNLYSGLGLNPVQLDFEGRNPSSTYSGGKAVDEIITRIQEKVFRNKGNLDLLSADEKTFVRNLENAGIIDRKRLSNISRRSKEGSKFRALVENRFSSAMSGASSRFLPNFADQLRRNVYDWDGTIIPRFSGKPDEYINKLNSLKEKDLLPIGKKLKAGKKKFDILTARPQIFENAISQTASRLGLPVNKINFGVRPKDKIIEANKRGAKIIDDDLSLLGKKGYLNARLVNKRLGSGFIPNFADLSQVMALESAMSGEKATYHSKPFPHVRNKSQPTFGSAMADHGGLNKALKDSVTGQKSAGLLSGGFIPNFAESSSSGSENTIAAVLAGLQGLAFSLVFINQQFKDAGKSIKESEESLTDFSSSVEKQEKNIGVLEKKRDKNLESIKNQTFGSKNVKKAEAGVAAAEKNLLDARSTGNRYDVVLAQDLLDKQQIRLVSAQEKETKARLASSKNLNDIIKAQKEGLAANKAETAARQKEIKQQKISRYTSLAFPVGSALQIAAPQIASFVPEENRGTRAGIEAVGNIAGMAGMGAMAGPWGALAGAAVGLALEIPKIEKALTSKMPEFEKAVTAATESFTKFSESGQQFLTASEQLKTISSDPNSSAEQVVAAEKNYVNVLASLPTKYQEQLVQAERLGKAQETYSQILEQLTLEKAGAETAAQTRSVFEKGKTGELEKIGRGFLALGELVITPGAALGQLAGQNTLNESSDRLKRNLNEAAFGDLVSSGDMSSIVNQTYAFTKVLDDASTPFNEASIAALNFGEKLDLAAAQIKNGDIQGGFEAEKATLISALKSAFSESGGILDGNETQILEELKNTINRPDQLLAWIEKYQSANDQFISAQENLDKARQAIEENRKREEAKRAKERERADKSAASLSVLQAQVDKVFKDFSSSIDDAVSGVKFQNQLKANRGDFAKDIYGLTNLPNAERNQDVNNRIFEIQRNGEEERTDILTKGTTGIIDSIGSSIAGLSLKEDQLTGLNEAEKITKVTDFEREKEQLRASLLGSGINEKLLKGDVGGARADAAKFISELKASGKFTESAIQDLQNKITKELDDIDRGVKTSNRNEQQQKALLAQQLAFEKARQKIVEAQSLGGGPEEITKGLLNEEDSLVNQIKDSLAATVGGGYNVGNLTTNEFGKIVDKATGEAPAFDKLGSLTDSISKLTRFAGVPIMSMGDTNFKAIAQGYSSFLSKSVDEFEAQAGGALGPEIFDRLREQIQSLQAGGDTGTMTAANLQLLQKFGAIDSGQYVDAVTSDYTKTAFEGLPKELKDAYMGVTGDTKLQVLTINNQTKEVVGKLNEVEDAIRESFDISKIGSQLEAAINKGRAAEMKISMENALSDAKEELSFAQTELDTKKGKTEESKKLRDLAISKFAGDNALQKADLGSENNASFIEMYSKAFSDEAIQQARTNVSTGASTAKQDKEFIKQAELFKDFVAADQAYKTAVGEQRSAEVQINKNKEKFGRAEANVTDIRSQLGANATPESIQSIVGRNAALGKEGYFTPGSTNFMNPNLVTATNKTAFSGIVQPNSQAPVTQNAMPRQPSPTEQALSTMPSMSAAAAGAGATYNISVPVSVTIPTSTPQDVQNGMATKVEAIYVDEIKAGVDRANQKINELRSELEKGGAIKAKPPMSTNKTLSSMTPDQLGSLQKKA
jgi:TP901 family phage tail tape measure protein